ncbi:MAG TPA: TetR family transcriptional regulator [Candidatus Avipropionibacterium avicola]|uniref:TetR family transcriptional regulator n=1 Tax=Candidatus Avipropionibacterium avicola TaxID=2840701 RepID=A0A9D1KP49_9ACTN|nr:TetR family transcriptional regulator [Candidatus Avipropionibacterium avicola]
MTRIEVTAQLRRDLVTAAVALLAEDGLRAVTHRRVEQRAGVSQGTVKYHFGSLDGLIAGVVEHMVEVEVVSVLVVPTDLVEAAMDSGEVPAEVWRRADAVVREMLERPGLVRARFELYLHAASRPGLQDVIARGRDEFVARTTESLSGVLPGGDPREGASVARMVLALVDGMLLHHLSAPHQSILDDGAAWLVGTAMAAPQVADLVVQHRR